MCHAHNEKWKRTNNWRNRTAKSRKNQNGLRKGKLQVLGNIGSRYHQTNWDEIKKRKVYLRQMRKLLETKQKSHQRDKHLISTPWKILRIILKMTKRWTQSKGPEDKKVDYDDTDWQYLSRKDGRRGFVSI